MIDELSKPKRWRRWVILAIVAFLAVSGLFFANHQSFSSRAAKLRPGMTRQEVIAVMGEPDRLSSVGDKEYALFTPLPYDLQELISARPRKPGGPMIVWATEFPAYVEFEGDTAARVRVDGHEVEAFDSESR
jgi:hypothetical protein